MPRLAIDSDYLSARLARLLEIPSPTGYTDTIVRECCDELRRLGVAFEVTRRGGIRAFMPGKSDKPARAIVSHLDTLGAQVKRIKENGRLELVPIGTWSARFAEGARVTVFSERGAFRGSILPLKASGHTFNEEVDQLPVGWPYVELRIDAMARSAADVDRLGIDVGDIVAIDPAPEFLENGFIVSRHLDNKAGAAVTFAAMDALLKAGDALTVDTYFIFTIAEEVGQRRRRRADARGRLHGDRRQRHQRAGAELRRVRRHRLHGRPVRPLRLSPDPQAGGAVPGERHPLPEGHLSLLPGRIPLPRSFPGRTFARH